jgi:hypothetical protein
VYPTEERFHQRLLPVGFGMPGIGRRGGSPQGFDGMDFTFFSPSILCPAIGASSPV